MQFTDFLVGSFGAPTSARPTDKDKDKESILAVMPSLKSLLEEVELSVPVAFQLVRPLIQCALQYGSDPEKCPDSIRPWHPYSAVMKEVILSNIPAQVWEVMSPSFYLTFWTSSLYDLEVPKSRYGLEVKRLKERYAEIDGRPRDSAGGAGGYGAGSGAVEDEKATKLRKSEMARILNTVKTLQEEENAQTKHVEQVRKEEVLSKLCLAVISGLLFIRKWMIGIKLCYRTLMGR